MNQARRLLLLVLAILLCAFPGAAAESATDGTESTEPTAYDGWTFEFTPYLWIPEVQGSVQIGRLDASIDVDFDKVFDLMGDGDLLAGMGQFEAQHGRFSFLVNAVGGTVQPTTQRQLTTVDTTLNFAFLEFGPTFRLLDYPTTGGTSITIDALAGGRFMYFFQEIAVSGRGGGRQGSADTTLTWVDPFVGGRWSVPLVDELRLFFRGDIGGFGAGSQLVWNLLGGFSYALPWEPFSSQTAVYLGYKAFDFDYRTGGGGSRRNALALDMRGPAIGLGFRF